VQLQFKEVNGDCYDESMSHLSLLLKQHQYIMFMCFGSKSINISVNGKHAKYAN